MLAITIITIIIATNIDLIMIIFITTISLKINIVILQLLVTTIFIAIIKKNQRRIIIYIWYLSTEKC